MDKHQTFLPKARLDTDQFGHRRVRWSPGPGPHPPRFQLSLVRRRPLFFRRSALLQCGVKYWLRRVGLTWHTNCGWLETARHILDKGGCQTLRCVFHQRCPGGFGVSLLSLGAFHRPVALGPPPDVHHLYGVCLSNSRRSHRQEGRQHVASSLAGSAGVP